MARPNPFASKGATAAKPADEAKPAAEEKAEETPVEETPAPKQEKPKSNTKAKDSSKADAEAEKAKENGLPVLRVEIAHAGGTSARVFPGVTFADAQWTTEVPKLAEFKGKLLLNPNAVVSLEGESVS